MPILDIQVWVKEGKNECETNKNQIFYQFYEKPMASQFVLMRNSAAPLSQKGTVLTQEKKTEKLQLELE